MSIPISSSNPTHLGGGGTTGGGGGGSSRGGRDDKKKFNWKRLASKGVTTDTESPLMDSKLKELDQTCSYMLAILKGMKKQQKCLRQYYEASDDLNDAIMTYSRSGFVSDDLSLSLDMIHKFESFYRAILVDLANHKFKIQEQIKEWIETSIPPARAEKKQFEVQKRTLDESYLKEARTAAEEKKGGEKAKLRLKECILEKEHAEDEYRKQGEKCYNKIIDTLENTKFFYLNQLFEHFSGYESFFQHGQMFVSQHSQMMVDIKERTLKEQQNFKMQSTSRPKGLWAPPDIGGDNKRVFAMNYQQIVDRDKPLGGIPLFLEQCFTLLEMRGLTTTGLFRLSPPKPALDAIREKIDKGLPLPLEELEDDVHMVSGLIKLFLREMPVPLLTFTLYPEWMSIPDLPPPDQPTKIRELLHKLPPANRLLLERLIYLCTRILEYTSENKMTVENLAIVLCPSILYDKDPDPLTMVADIQKGNGIMVNMCIHFHSIFDGIAQSNRLPLSPRSSCLPPLPAMVSPLSPPSAPPTSVPQPSSAPSLSTSQKEKDRRGSVTPKMALGGSRTKTIKSSMTLPHRKNTPDRPHLTTILSPPSQAPQHVTFSPTSPAGSSPRNGPSQEAESYLEIQRGSHQLLVPITDSPSPPPLSTSQVYRLLEGREQQRDGAAIAGFYLQLYELFDGTFVFSRATFLMKEGTVDELNHLNSAFQVVGKAIKTVLSFIKEYSSKFPPEIGRRILSTANQVRPHIKSLIGYVKAFNSRQKIDSSALVLATKEFIIGTYQLYLQCYRASQMDELSLAAFKCRNLLKQLGDMLREYRQIEASTNLNNLQYFTLKLTSLLRSRLSDVEETSALQQQVAAVIEAAEQCIGEIFDAAREMLMVGDLRLTPSLEEAMEMLHGCVETVIGLRGAIEDACCVVDLGTTLELIVEQVEGMVELHGEIQVPFIRALLEQMVLLSGQLQVLKGMYPIAVEEPKEWMGEVAKVVVVLERIKGEVFALVSKIQEEALQEAVRSYCTSTEHFLVQFKIGATAVAFGVNFSGFEPVVAFINPIKDFLFISFPFIYNLLEVLGITE